jgi:mutator protein MutT
MKLVPVSVAMFVRASPGIGFETWIQQRTDGPLVGKWEFPGGKIELGETPWEALVREIKEETAVIIKGHGKQLGIFNHDYGDKRVLLHIFKVPWESELERADGLIVPLHSHSTGKDWGVDLLEANFRLVEHLCRSLYDSDDDKSIS